MSGREHERIAGNVFKAPFALAVDCALSLALAAGGAAGASDKSRSVIDTARPIRVPERITITVGQGRGDLQGTDDKVIQAAIDYVFRLGGGTVHILPGTYTLRNAIRPRPGVTLRGSGGETILKKGPTVRTRLVREADWFEYAVQVSDPTGFAPGAGIALSSDRKDYPEIRFYTVTAVHGNLIYLDRRTEKNFWMSENAVARTLFSIIYALNVNDVRIEDLVLDGNREENEQVNGNYAGAVFMQYCDRWRFRNVIARNYNGDGFSFQVCDDIQFENCQSLNNANLGFHPGSGSQRPVFRRCVSKGNDYGIFFCWGACDGVVEDCVISDNRSFGIDFGHRDTDNVVRRCVIERNGVAGIRFRKEVNEFRTADRNLIERCVIRDNGGKKGDAGVDVVWKTKGITIRHCRFENGPDGPQRVGVRIAPEAEDITLEDNTFVGCPVEVEDLRAKD